MKVKSNNDMFSLIFGTKPISKEKIYDVLIEEKYQYQIRNDLGKIEWYNKNLFEIIKEEDIMFKKEDLKSGMLVLVKSRVVESWYLVIGDVIFNITDCNEVGFCFIRLNEFDVNLQHKHPFKIIKIGECEPSQLTYLFREIYEDKTAEDFIKNIQIIWERDEKSEQQIKLEKVISDLETQLEKAKSELNKLK